MSSCSLFFFLNEIFIKWFGRNLSSNSFGSIIFLQKNKPKHCWNSIKWHHSNVYVQTRGLSIHQTSPLTILHTTVMPTYCVDYISLGGIYSDSTLAITSIQNINKFPQRFIYTRCTRSFLCVCVQISFDRLLLLVHPQIRFYFYITTISLSISRIYR